jgi:hypothetical protein
VANRFSEVNFIPMKRFFSVAVICMVFLSCSQRNNADDLLSRYASLNCEHQKLIARKDNVTKIKINSLQKELSQLEHDYNEMSAVYDDKVTILNEKRNEAGTQYTQDYVRISKKHEENHGHFMTPQYRKAIDELERVKSSKFQTIDNEISNLNNAKQADEDLKKMEKEIHLLKMKIDIDKRTLKEIDERLHDQESELAGINKQLNETIGKFTDSDRTHLQRDKDSIRVQPCNQK